MPDAYYCSKCFFTIRDFHKHSSAEYGQYTLFMANYKAYFMSRSRVPEIIWEAE